MYLSGVEWFVAISLRIPNWGNVLFIHDAYLLLNGKFTHFQYPDLKNHDK